MGILERYLEASLTGGICIILAVLLFLVFGTGFKKKYKMLVWFLILVRLLLPVPHQQKNSGLVVEIPNYTLVEFDVSETDENEVEISENNQSDVSQPIAEKQSVNWQLTTGNIVFAVWFAGVTVFLGYYILLHMKLNSKMKQQRQLCEETAILEKVKQYAQETGLRKLPKVYNMDGSYGSPFSTGVIRKSIYLPELPYIEKDLDYILKHELIHCKNHDVLLKFFILAANAVHWFNPLVWMMRGLVNQDMELICDEAVLLEATKEECRDYSEIIMSHITAEQTKHSALSTSYIQGTRFIKYRFQNIFAGHKKNGIQFCAVFIAVTILFLHGKIQIWELPAVKALAQVPICYGYDIRVDMDGDGKNDMVYVLDGVDGAEKYTQLAVKFANGDRTFTNYPGNWGSYLVSGDFDGNGQADIVLKRGSKTSPYGFGPVNVLYIEDGKWKEYPRNFISNASITMEQPVGFMEQLLGAPFCMDVTIVKKNRQTMLRFILGADIGNDIATCIDCSWNGNGWYIEDMQQITDYYGGYKDMELLESHFNY